MSFASLNAPDAALRPRAVSRAAPALPDIAAARRPDYPRALDRVGMEKIPVVVRIERGDGAMVELPAEADASVRLDRPEAKGIHMSRLFLALDKRLAGEALRPATLAATLADFAASHRDLGRGAFLRLRFEWMRRQPGRRRCGRQD